MLTRGESTNPALFLQALIDHGLSFEVHANPGRVSCFINGADGSEVAHVNGTGISVLLEAVPAVNSIDSPRVPSPSQATRDYATNLQTFGYGKRLFIAIDGLGNVVLYGDDRQPAAFRQRAAAERNGRTANAVAVWDFAADRVEWIVGG